MSSFKADAVRLGICGLGMAGASMVPVALAHPHIRLVAAADHSEELRRRFAGDTGVPAEPDLTSLLARDDLDAVYLATPHQFHRPHTEQVAAAGKHVLVEKPMALTLADCDAMIEATGRAGVSLIVGHTHAFDPAIARMRQLADTGDLGRVCMLHLFRYSNFMYRPRRPEELDTSAGGGIIYNQLPHQIDIARYLAASRVRSVRAWAGTLDANRPTEGCANVFIEFESGASATLVYSGYDGFDSDEFHGWVGVTGNRKTAAHGTARRNLGSYGGRSGEGQARTKLFGYGGQARKNLDEPTAPYQPHFGSVIATCEAGDMRTCEEGVMIYSERGAELVKLDTGFGAPGFAAVLDELCAAVRGEGVAVRDGVFSRGTVETVLAVLKSAQERREVILSVDNPLPRSGETLDEV